MVRIRHVKINGMYSYGSEKNRINFGQKTVVVGASDAGKSSIFKAMKFFLECLTEHDFDRPSPPWDRRGTHEVTVGLSLSDEERRYTAEILSVLGAEDRRQPSLAREAVAEWLAPRLKRAELTIDWRYDLRPAPDHIEYFLRLDDLGTTVYSPRYNNDAWMFESSRFPTTHEPNATLLHDVLSSMLENGSAAEGLGARLGQGAKISNLPDIRRLERMESTGSHRRRLELVDKMSEGRKKHDPYSFFVMFGRMLERGFAFVLERRWFQESNDLEKLPLMSDGSNLQSYLFWLQNGGKDEQDACSAIRKMFEAVMEQQKLSFVVSVKRKEVSHEEPQSQGMAAAHRARVKRKEVSHEEPIYDAEKAVPDRAVVQFVRKIGRERGLLDFASIGIGAMETLFLLSMCFVNRDKVILLDEPAANLHPTQIRRLMREIASAGDQDSKSGQVAVITHSPTLASLGLLSRTNEIVRVSRREHSIVAQPSGEDREWIEENLATFHLLKSDVFFARGVVLVEGPSDRFFLEAILDGSLDQSGDIAVVDVGGKKSFKKFRRLLGIFEIPHVILADGDAKEKFDPDEVVEIDTEDVPKAEDGTGRRVCILGKTLEGFLSDLEPVLCAELEKEYETKPERAYHFAEGFFAGDLSEKSTKLLKFLIEWMSKNLEGAGQYGDPSSNPKGLPAGSTSGTA